MKGQGNGAKRGPASRGLGLAFLALTAATGGLGVVTAAPNGDTVIYVSPSGDDAWSGKQPTVKGTDGPVATPQRALALARERRAATGGGATILLRGGTYYLDRPLTLEPADSGTAGAPTRIAAYRGERPRLVGGRPVAGFQPHQGPILRCDLKAQGLAGVVFNELYLDGKRQILARYPNFDPKNPVGGGWLYTHAVAEKGSMRAFRAAPGDLKPWKDLSQAEAFHFHAHNYYNNILPLAAADPTTGVVRYGKDSYGEIKGEGAERYYLRGLLEELDAPGEWYADRKNATLYFYPPAPLGSAVVEVPVLDNVVRMRPGTAHVVLDRLLIECARESAVLMEDARECLVTACTVRNCGVGTRGTHHSSWDPLAAIAIHGGTNNGAVGNDIYDVGSHGIRLTGGDRKTLTPAGNYAENNHIHHTGLDWKQGCGARIEGVGSRFSRNLIHDCPRFAIIFGGNDHIIEYNHLHHTNLETFDTGAIYTGGRDAISPYGSVVRYNYIHDIGGYGRRGKEWTTPEFSWGIYLDDMASGADVIGNIVVGGARGGLHIHNGRHNLIENNIFIGGIAQQIETNGWARSHQFAPTVAQNFTEYSAIPAWSKYRGFRETPPHTATQMSGNQFRRNIFYFSDPKARLYKHNRLPLDESAFDHNLVYHFGHPLVLGMQQLHKVQVPENAPELCPVGSMEAGAPGALPSGWSWFTRPGAGAAAAVEEGARTGKRCLRVDAASGKNAQGQTQHIMLRTGEIAVQPGRAYLLTVWAKADKPGRQINLVAQSYRAGVHHWASEDSFPVTTEWKPYSLAIKVPGPGDPGYIATITHFWLRLDFREAEGTFWVDDVSLKEGALQGTERDEWQSWQALGLDRNSRIADPLFVDAKAGDYRLREESPAFALGFKPIAVEKIGPYADPRRASWPIADPVGERAKPWAR